MSDSETTLPKPSLLGLRAAFGFGDRLGLATPGHIAALKKGNLLPVFAQQSVRELARTDRTAEEVMAAAQGALKREGWTGAFGADADHLKTREDVIRMAGAGFTFFTIDPSEYVNNRADRMGPPDLAAAVDEVVQFGAFESSGQAESLYLGKSFDLPGAGSLVFREKTALHRAVVKYGRAIAFSEKMWEWIEAAETPRGAEVEISVDETETPTTALEHLFIALELKRRGVPFVSLAPRFVGEFEKGIDYKGDPALFESTLKQHVAIARLCGPYKISVHSGSDKFKVYPILGRVCGDLLHVKTAGTSYLEALRVVARKAPGLFWEIVDYARTRFDTDRASYHISAELAGLPLPGSLEPKEREAVYLDGDHGRQVLHVTFGSVLTLGCTGKGRPFKEAIMEILEENEDLHREVLALHLGRHVALLCQG